MSLPFLNPHLPDLSRPSPCRDAAEKAGEHTEAALIGTALPMYVPEFKNVIMPTITSALDEWKADAEKSEGVRGTRSGGRPGWGTQGRVKGLWGQAGFSFPGRR